MGILKSESSGLTSHANFFSFFRRVTGAVVLFAVVCAVNPAFAQHSTMQDSAISAQSGTASQDVTAMQDTPQNAPITTAEIPSENARAQQSLIKVGFVDNDDTFSAIDENGVKTGYAYEYLQYTAYYANLQYEYVYGDFQALYEKLRNGEIDMLLHVFKLDSNPDNLIYSDYAIGTESIFLFVKPENTSVIQNNLKTIDGKTVAVANNFYGFTFFKSWLARNNLSCSVVTFDTEKDAINAFERGDTDMLLYSDTHSNLDWIPLSRIAAFDYYIALAPGSNELYEELSRAQNKMYQMNPNLNYMIYNYMYSSLYYDWRLSEDETAWLENHPVVAIGCLKNNLPISDFDNSKKPCGFIADYMDVVKKELRLPSFTIYYKYYNDEESLIQALKNGEIDVAFPVSTDI